MFSWRGIEIQFGWRGGYPGFRKRMTVPGAALSKPGHALSQCKHTFLLNPKPLPVTAPLDSHKWTSYGMDSVETCLLTFHNAGIKEGVGWSEKHDENIFQHAVHFWLYSEICCLKPSRWCSWFTSISKFLCSCKIILVHPHQQCWLWKEIFHIQPHQDQCAKSTSVSTVNSQHSDADVCRNSSTQTWTTLVSFEHWCGIKDRRSHGLLTADWISKSITIQSLVLLLLLEQFFSMQYCCILISCDLLVSTSFQLAYCLYE